ncbi:MAG TPA: MFS transporter [Solirubrobacteraceae bacterium]|nr:MFS transporter [Solirubrobacteraceae bacterium]
MTSSDSPRPTDPQTPVSRRLVLLLAFTCGAAVANLYYAQPLLHTLAQTFSVSQSTAGLLVTASQVGYAIGLAFLVPLGDLLERRRLIVAILLVCAVGQAASAAAPDFGVFALAVGVVGVSSAVAQIIVPMASSLAADHERGRVVGTVMSGLLIGILTARTASGVLAGLLGWRAVFVIATGVMVVLAATLRWALPKVPPTESLPYRALLRSVVSLVAQEPLLRQRMALGAAVMGCFSALWTSIAFLLSGPPYNYGNTAIGLFGLAGIAGAAIAPVAGRLADHGRGKLATSAGLLILLASWGLLLLGAHSVVLLVAGIVALDLGVQGVHISNQSAIYALHADARSRITTAYMLAYFAGAAAMSAAASALYGSDGWTGVCVLGGAVAAAGLVVWLVTERPSLASLRLGTASERG